MSKILTFGLLAFFLQLWSMNAHAEAPVTKTWYVAGGTYNASPPGCPTASSGPIPPSPAGLTWGAMSFTNGTMYCAVMYQGNIYGQVSSGTYVSATRCVADGSAPDTSKPLANQCPTVACQDKSTQRVVGPIYPTDAALGAAPIPNANGACGFKITGVSGCYSGTNPATGLPGFQCVFTGNNTGADAPTGSNAGTASTTPPPGTRVPAPPVPASGGSCPSGSVSGGLDSGGVMICIGMGADPVNGGPANKTETKAPVTTSNPDGSISEVGEKKTTNSDGSITTTVSTKTTASNGTVTSSETESTGTRPGSTTIGKKDTQEDKSDLCARNPTLTICRNSTVVGTCGEISCNGDAIQCATLRAAAAMECKARTETDEIKASPGHALGSAMMAGNDPLKSTFPTVASATVVQAPSALDNSGWLGGGSCFADKTVVVMGKSIVLPFSKSCDALIGLRLALMVVAGLVSFKIISGAVLS
jgi:hypothetical protein